jgi:uncharacterized cupin superfamily protein
MSTVIIERLSEDEIKKREIRTWPIWEKEISTFDWFYDGQEQCLFIKGEVEIETTDGNFKITAGDSVTFQPGLKCIWHILKPVRKHYNFD